MKNMIVQTVSKIENENPDFSCEVDKNEKVQSKTIQDTENESDESKQNINENFENEILANTIFSLFVNFSRCIEDDYQRKFQSGRKMIDSKLRKMMQEKKQSLGIKQEHGQTQKY